MGNFERRSLQMTKDEWESLENLAKRLETLAPTGTHVGLPSWRSLMKRIARAGLTDNVAKMDGVVVIKVIPNTPAARAGVRVKDIITQINTYEVKTLEDYLYATSKSYEKVLVKTNRAFLMIKKE